MQRAKIFLIALIWALSAPAARGDWSPPLSERVPDDAVVYLGWGGADAVPSVAGYDGSHLKSLLDSSNLGAISHDLMPKVFDRIAAVVPPDARDKVDLFRRAAGAAWHYPTAMYATFDFSGAFPMPHFAIFTRAGAEAADLQKVIDAQLAKVAAPSEVPWRTFLVDDPAGAIVGLSAGFEDGRMSIVGAGNDHAKPLVAQEDFNNTLAKIHASDSAVVFYFDNDAALKIADQMIALSPNGDVQEHWGKARAALGLDNIHRAVAAAGFDGKNWSMRAFVDAPAPRKGLAAMMSEPPVSDEPFKLIPADATIASAGYGDLGNIIGNVRTMLGEIDINLQTKFNQVLGLAQMYTGVSLEKDLFAALGNEWATYIDPQIAGDGSLGVVVVNKLKDAAKAERSLNAIGTAFNNTMIGVLRDKPVRLSVRTFDSGELKIHYLATPVVAPSWTIKDGTLYVALYPQLALAAAQRGVPEKSILDNPDFVAARKLLDVEHPSSVLYEDMPRVARENYQSLLVLMRSGLGLADLFKIEAPEGVTPSLADLEKNLEPAISATWSDDSGIYFRSLSPFPLSSLAVSPATTAAVGYAALSTSIMLPSLTRARETANRVKCASNERQIGQAILLYANDNKGHYPPDLGTLVVTEDIAPQVFFCPNDTVSMPPNWAKMTNDEKVAWIDEHSSYQYLGAQMTTQVEANVPVVYERDGDHNGDGMNILFGDGHVEFNMMPQAKKLLANPNEKPGGL